MSRKSALKQLAKATKDLSYVDTEDLAFDLRQSAVCREDNVGIKFDPDDYLHWIELIQGWATGKLDQ